jgi:hypothetical protein
MTITGVNLTVAARVVASDNIDRFRTEATLSNVSDCAPRVELDTS